MLLPSRYFIFILVFSVYQLDEIFVGSVRGGVIALVMGQQQQKPDFLQDVCVRGGGGERFTAY